ncbi:MAG: hypothetical protein V4646_12515 [Pseudomonadota bacterium]
MKPLMPADLSTPEERAKLIRPIEELLIPAALDGSTAWAIPWDAREPTTFANDIQAVKAWLDGYSGGSMRTGCRLAIEKVLLWCVVERGHALAELSGEEVDLFIQFLMTPEPKTRWVTVSIGHRTRADWRPFRVAMSARHVGITLALIRLYFRWANAHGLLLGGHLLHALCAPLENERSSMATANQPLKLDKISTPDWIALHPYLPDDSESFKDLQVLGLLQMLYYGGISYKQITGLRLKDFVAHQRGGRVAAWEFPSGIENSTVFSSGPLTNTLTRLLGLVPVPNGVSRREILVFQRCNVRVVQVFKSATTQARAFFENAGELDRGASLSKLHLVNLRGGVIHSARREVGPINLASVFSWVYLKAYPTVAPYLLSHLDWDLEKRLQSATNLSDWINASERAHMERSKLPP